MGPVGLRLSAQLQTEANDNVRLEENQQHEDLVLRPQLNTVAIWRLSERNSLVLSTGVGYARYLNETEPGRVYVTPNSDLSLDLYAGDFLINFHDRFSYLQDVVADAQIAGIGSLNRIENTSGVGVTWDLNKLILGLVYDHSIYVATDDAYSYQDRSGELFNANAMFTISPTTVAGLAVNGGLVNVEHHGGPLNDNQQIGAGPVLMIQLSDYFSLRASLGYAVYFFDQTGTNSPASSTGALYADLTLQQRVNDSLSQSASIGRQLQSGLFSDTVDLIYVRYGADWRVFRETSFHPSFSYEHVHQSLGQTEDADRYGINLAFGRQLTEKLSGDLQYNFYLRDSDVASRSYTQNRLVLTLVYAF